MQKAHPSLRLKKSLLQPTIACRSLRRKCGSVPFHISGLSEKKAINFSGAIILFQVDHIFSPPPFFPGYTKPCTTTSLLPFTIVLCILMASFYARIMGSFLARKLEGRSPSTFPLFPELTFFIKKCEKFRAKFKLLSSMGGLFQIRFCPAVCHVPKILRWDVIQ